MKRVSSVMAAAVSHLRPPLPFQPASAIPNPNPSGRKYHLDAHPSLKRNCLSASPFGLKAGRRHLVCGQSNKRSTKYAVLGAGFAGLSVTWHLLKHSLKSSNICIDIYDEVGIGGGASGASGGLLHPYSPKAKVLWRGAECWKECLKLLTAAEMSVKTRITNRNYHDASCSFDEPIILRRGILRPATSEKSMEVLKENAQNCLQSCTLEVLDGDAARSLVPDLRVPFDSAIYMPLAMNINPKRYLQALFLACQSLANEDSASDRGEREIKLCKKSVSSLHELAGEYDEVIICLGAKANMLTELSGRLPLRTCRGVIAQFQLPADDKGGEYYHQSPSILSEAWLAFQGPQSVLIGSTWEWKSDNYSSSVDAEEASRAVEELLPKASAVYPTINTWDYVEARAGLRAMPPLTPLGSLPLLGCVDDAVRERNKSRYWLVGGLGARGLLYHGLLGKLMAKAIVSSDETILPYELTSWKLLKQWREIG